MVLVKKYPAKQGILFFLFFWLFLSWRLRFDVILWPLHQEDKGHGRGLVFPLLQGPTIFQILISLFEGSCVFPISNEIVIVFDFLSLRCCHILTINQSQGELGNGRFP